MIYGVDTGFIWLRTYAPWLWIVIDYITLCCVDLVRLFAGGVAARGLEKCKRPAKPIKFYEFESCPYCRRVRETLSCLDIDHEVYPCPRETLTQYGVCLNSRFRTVAKKEGGMVKFPYIIDPNTNTKMYETLDIIAYLWSTYGSEATAPLNYRVAHSKVYIWLTMMFCTLLRPCMDMGILRAPSKAPEKNIEFYGVESSGGCRRVKETMSTLEIPYNFHVMPCGGDKKKKVDFMKEHPGAQGCSILPRSFCKGAKLPYLRDPNTGKDMFGSHAIVHYLKTQYQTAPVPAETWFDMKH